MRFLFVVVALIVVAACEAPGTHGGPCTSGGHCDVGLACVDDVCIESGEGEGSRGEGEGAGGEGEGGAGEGEGAPVAIEGFTAVTTAFNADLRFIELTDLATDPGCSWAAAPDATPTTDAHALLVLDGNLCNSASAVDAVDADCSTSIDLTPGKTCVVYRAYHGGAEERAVASSGTVTSAVNGDAGGIFCDVDIDIGFATGERLTTTIHWTDQSPQPATDVYCPL